MYSKPIFLLAAGAGLAVGKTPSGFSPASTVDLIVTYGSTSAMNGIVVAQDTTKTAPTVATSSKLTGSSYAIIMLDLDIPTNTNPHVLLHWMQTDLTPSTKASSLATSNGTGSVFVLTNEKNTTALASYIGPGPPAKTPLSHRYTQILIDTSSLKANGTAALKSAAASRQGFDITTVLKKAGLSNNVVAGNSFNVTNPGPADDSTTSTNSTSGTGSGSKKNSTTTGTTSQASATSKAGTSASATSTAVISTGGAYALIPTASTMVFGLLLSGLCLAI